MSSKKQSVKIFIVAMGPGEIGQGIAFAQYALKKGASITFAIYDKTHSPMVNLDLKNFKVVLVKTSKSLNRAVFIHKPDVFLLCNSKIFSRDGFYPTHPPVPKLPIISIDSNWLFGPNSPYKSLPWVDKICINIPEKVFRLGLKQYGGHYAIPKESLRKIKIVGLLPSYSKISLSSVKKTRDKYGILQGEKLILLYASTASLTPSFQSQIFKNGIDAVRILRDKGHKIKIINVSKKQPDILKIKEEWILNLNHVDASEFYRILASSDLIFQHQGLGTLEQAISANVPAIMNVRDLKDEESPYHAHEWEVLPFSKSGACSLLYPSAPLEAAVREVEKLLYDNKAISQMKRQQARLYACGEKGVYEEMKKLIDQFKKTSR